MLPTDLSGCRVTVMGLGLHGGGIETARYLSRHGALVTVTDTRSETDLAPSLKKLEGLPVRYVLGTHEVADFATADMVVKNPAVPRKTAILSQARRIETDISLFLKMSSNPVIAVTGSKGKSTTVTAIHHVIKGRDLRACLGGNITVSPLTFVDDIEPDAPVILEISSFQLGDLLLVDRGEGWRLLHPTVSVVTNILPDHQNYYHSMATYIADKKLVFRGQSSDQFTLVNFDQSEGRNFAQQTPARPFFFSVAPLPENVSGGYFRGDTGWIRTPDGETRILEPSNIPAATRTNLLVAGTALSLFGVSPAEIRRGLASFPGIEHRMELFAERDGVRFINDSASTIPEATAAAIAGTPGRVLLVAGGTDKELSFELFTDIARSAAETHLLAGSATEKIIQLLDAAKIGYFGPYTSLSACIEAVGRRCSSGTTVLFSPGCTSFGMFLNEFDRGRQFKSLVLEMFAPVDTP
ncbi:MAG TPA: UDP-N-acetylmuramoyl-L-alanine--D-glutamate ligase [Spirochaetia bacterium]|nr:UDP-N-acetylmuramoyl-L-alanine--D-glutamate ligase [Spirochaetia bacterium]